MVRACDERKCHGITRNRRLRRAAKNDDRQMLASSMTTHIEYESHTRLTLDQGFLVRRMALAAATGQTDSWLLFEI